MENKNRQSIYSSFSILHSSLISAFPTYEASEGCCAPQASFPAALYSSFSVLHAALESIYHHRADFSPELFEQQSNTLQQAIKQGFGDRNHSYEKPDHALKAMFEMNLYRFSAAKTLAMAKTMNDHARKAKSFSDFKQKVAQDRHLQNASEAYLKTEYNYALNASASAARYHEYVGQKDVLPYWQYKTMNDSGVRDSHRSLHNKIFKADDAVFNQIYPPNGWGCRCEVIPVKQAPEGTTTAEQGLQLLGSEELAKMTKNRMNINRAKAGHLFAEAQFYVKDLEGFKWKTAKMGARDFYGSNDYRWEKIKNKFQPFKANIQDPHQARQWFEKHKNKDDIVVLSDYSQRPIRLTKDTLELKTGKAGENRHELVNHLESILKNPHEVWPTKYKDAK